METTVPMLQVQCKSKSKEKDHGKVKLVQKRPPRRGHPSPFTKQRRGNMSRDDILPSTHDEGSDGGFQVSIHLEEELLDSNHQESSEEDCLVSSHDECSDEGVQSSGHQENE
jgi:hypothetical protein